MSDPFLGPAVQNGLVRFFSTSALERADTRQSGCARKWWYRYVCRIKDESSPESKAAGIAMHDEIAAYERTGVKALSALVLSGLHLIPDPGPDLIIERPINIIDRTGIHSMIGAAGVPLIGKVDCAHGRGTNKGTEDILEAYDPPGTIEIIDWKWKKDGSKSEYYLQPKELVRSIQMSGYGLGLGRALNASYVRLSHVYFPKTRGKPRKITKLHVLDDCARSWEYTEGLGRTLVDVAKETSPERVPANSHACDRFGGCPYRLAPINCTGFQQQSLANLFGETQSEDIMGLMSTLPPVANAGAVAPAPAIDIRMQLQQEENAQRAAAAATSVGILAGFPEACATIQRSGRGFPGLGGAAAQMYAAMGGQSIAPGTRFQGLGDLGALEMVDPTHVIQIGNELAADEQRRANAAAAAQVATQPQAVVAPQPFNAAAALSSILPPDAPASNPALAAKPLEPIVQQPIAQPQVPVTIVQPVASLPTMVFNPQPIVTTAQPQVAVPTAMTAQPADKPKRGRKPKASATEPVTPASELEVYVDCLPNGDFESLHPYLDMILARLCDKFIAPDGLKDVRLAPKDGPLGFGGYRGAVKAMVLEVPPPIGHYFIDTRNNDLACELAEAMRIICERTASLYVKGIR